MFPNIIIITNFQKTLILWLKGKYINIILSIKFPKLTIHELQHYGTQSIIHVYV